jgi:hypothetical protein
LHYKAEKISFCRKVRVRQVVVADNPVLREVRIEQLQAVKVCERIVPKPISRREADAVPSGAQQAVATQQAPAAGGGADLQKATQNPVSSFISVPVQNNDNFGIGPFNRTQNVLNIQPVVPTKLSDSVNMIIRWITPIIYQPAPGTRTWRCTGLKRTRQLTLRRRRCRIGRECPALGI